MDDVTLGWKGREFTVKATDRMRLIATIEDQLTITELSSWDSAEKVKLSKLAAAYGAALRFAGAWVSDEDVYTALFGNDAEGMARLAVNTLNSIMVPMIPPEHLQDKSGKKKEPSKARSSSSRKRTKPPSGGS
jgi:hypothetical protein